MGLNVCRMKVEVGRVDCGLVNTVETRNKITVFNVASEESGFVKLNRVPLPVTVAAEHGVET